MNNSIIHDVLQAYDFPATLLGLMLLHGLLAGELPFIHKRKVVTRKNNAEQKGDQA